MTKIVTNSHLPGRHDGTPPVIGSLPPLAASLRGGIRSRRFAIGVYFSWVGATLAVAPVTPYIRRLRLFGRPQGSPLRGFAGCVVPANDGMCDRLCETFIIKIKQPRMTDGTGCLSVCGKQSRRDYLLVEKYDAPTVRMPSGMHLAGLHTYGMQEPGNRHFLPKDTFRMECSKSKKTIEKSPDFPDMVRFRHWQPKMTDGTGCLSVCGKQSRRDYLLVEKMIAPRFYVPSGTLCAGVFFMM